MNLCIIVLAAGNSRRFGENKLLYPIQGISMADRVFSQVHYSQKLMKDFSPSVTVVTQYEEIESKARSHGFSVLYNPHPEEGISSSIAIGLKGSPGFDSYLFLVCDQPWIRAETLRDLVLTHQSAGKGITCVSFHGRLGNPCIFSKKYIPQLLKLKGESGGKQVIAANRKDTFCMQVNSEQELTDMDTKPCNRE